MTTVAITARPSRLRVLIATLLDPERRAALLARANFARINHILIPATSDARDRLRRSLFARALGPITWFYVALSEEGRVLWVISVIVGSAGLEVAINQVHVLWCALTALLVMSLCARPFFALRGVTVEVEPPKRATMGEEAIFGITLINDDDRDHAAVRVLGPMLPWDGQWTTSRPAAPRLPARGRVRVEARARFADRGEHHLDPFHAAALVPLGFAQGRLVKSEAVRFLVVPKIARVQRLALPETQRYQPGGVALASKTGESMELLGVRPYRPGDPIRDLHARSSARLGVPIVREYQQEYFARIGVVLDTDGAVATLDQLEAAISLAAGVIAHLSRGEALIDVLVVGDEVHPLTVGRSLGFLEQALDLLACVKSGPPASPDRLLRRLAPYLGRLSSVVVVALTWDPTRAQLVDSIRRRGVACRPLVVTAKKRGDAAAHKSRDGGPTEITAASIRGGEPLLL